MKQSSAPRIKAKTTKIADSEVDSKYKKYIVKRLEKNVIDNLDMNFIFSTGLDLKDTLIDPKKARVILEHGRIYLCMGVLISPI